MSDLNTGGFTSNLDANTTIEIHSSCVKLKHSMYANLYFKDVIPALQKRLTQFHHNEPIIKKTFPTYKTQDKPITQNRFWQRMSYFIPENSIIVAEAGTSLFGSLEIPIADGTTFVGQPLWSSIGYTVGATLGTCIAEPERQSILFVGDGSFQLTAQEVSSMIRHLLTPIIFLINNDGYTVERVIHGLKEPYNDIQMWNYAQLPQIFGDAVWTTKVATENQLEEALEETKRQHNKLIFIEVIMDKYDAPEVLKKIGKVIAEQNR
jgi:pyruvate decarboxylase/indolepyruvate decarboxylase